MTFGVTLLLDPHTTDAVQNLWLAQVKAGLPDFMLHLDYPPHITLMAASGDGDLAGLRRALSSLAARTSPVHVTFLALGVFPAEYGVIFLAPTINQALLDLHQAVWQAAEPYVDSPMDLHRPGVWVPHVTLSNRLQPGQLGQAAEFLASQPWPRSGTLTGFMFGDFEITGGSVLEQVVFSNSQVNHD